MCLLTGLKQEPAIMKCKAQDLLYSTHNVPVAHPASPQLRISQMAGKPCTDLFFEGRLDSDGLVEG